MFEKAKWEGQFGKFGLLRADKYFGFGSFLVCFEAAGPLSFFLEGPAVRTRGREDAFG